MTVIDGLCITMDEKNEWVTVSFNYKRETPPDLAKVFREIAKAIENQQIRVWHTIQAVKL